MADWITLGGAAWRYASLLRSQYGDPAKRRDLEERRFAETLAAAVRIPFYREHFGRRTAPGDLDGLPVLRRGDVHRLAASVRALGPARVWSGQSSGSTGTPVEFLFDRCHQQGRFAARLRYLTANGWNPVQRSAWIVNVVPGGRSPDGQLTASRLLSGSRFHLHTTPFRDQLAWLRAVRPVTLYTYPSNLQGLLHEIGGGDPGLPSLRRILTGAEVLEPALRHDVERCFGVPVSDNYGSTETFLAFECPAGRLHRNVEHVRVEIVDVNDRPSPPGAIGRVVATTLENRLMPLVRYEIGDYAVAGGDEACPCGRTLPLLGRVLGRGINLFRARDGRLFSPWDLTAALKQTPSLRQYQLVQRAPGRFLVRYVADADLDAASRDAIVWRFREELGDPPEVTFERREEIPRAPSGKFMTALSEAPSGHEVDQRVE